MPRLNIFTASLALVLGLAGAAIAQPTTTTTTTTTRTTSGGATEVTSSSSSSSQSSSSSSSRSSSTTTIIAPPTPAQQNPGRRDWNISVGDDDADKNDDWMTRQQVARIVLYDPANFSGRRIGVTQDTPDLGRRRFADVASSIRVYGGTWELCEEVNYGGQCRRFSSHTNVNRFGIGNPVSETNLETDGFGDRVSSIRLVPNR